MGWVPEEGEVVLEKYRIVKQLGLGGTGVVFKALNVITDGYVALKFLNSNAQDSAEFYVRLSREARAAAKLKSRFTARVIDFEHTTDGNPVLIMELLEGNDLRDELRTEATLTVDEAVGYVVQACAAVAEAHIAGVIHRDLKPGNLFLDRSNPTCPVVRVLDFGVAKVLDNETKNELTAPNDAVGTLAYMSPEQMRAAKDVTARTDVWSLGVVLYRALMGTLPLDGKGVGLALHTLDERPLPRVERAGVSAELAAVIARALEKDAARRYPDARAFGLALRPHIREPSPSTTLAFEELLELPGPRVSLPSAPPMEEAAPRSVPAPRSEPAPATAPAPPPDAKPASRPFTRETRLLLAGSFFLGLACVLVIARRPHARPRAVVPAAPSVSVAIATVEPTTTSPPVLPLPPAPSAPPAASSAPRIVVRPKPAAAPKPAPKPTPEEEIPVRY